MTVKAVRYSNNIDADIRRGWSAWMGLEANRKDDAVLLAWESQGRGGESELDDLYQDAPEPDWNSFIDRMAEELDVRFDDNCQMWRVVHHEGLSCYVVNDGSYTAEEEAAAIARYARDTPTGEGHYTIGGIRVVEALADGWYLLECEGYGIE